MTTGIVVTRVCRCGCLQTFMPHKNRPGQEYKYGHKVRPGGKRTLPAGKAAVLSQPRAQKQEEARDGERRTLNYKLALMAVRRELELCDQEIENADDEAECIRVEKMRPLQLIIEGILDRKGQIVDRHAQLTATAEDLQKLIGAPA
jgi:hypothetical protein